MSREQALSLHRSGQLESAQRAYESMLQIQPDDSDLLGLLGILSLQKGNRCKAEELLRASLKPPVDQRVRLRNLNSLIVLLRDAGRDGDVAQLVRDERFDWCDGPEPGEQERATVLSLVEALMLYGQAAKAQALLFGALTDRSRDGAALNLEGRLRLENGDAEGAVEILFRACQLAPQDWQPFVALSYAQKQSGFDDAARATMRHLTRVWPVYADPPRPSQRANIIVLNSAPTTVRELNGSIRQLHYSHNYPSEMSKRLAHEYRFISLLGDIDSEYIPEELPPADIVLNNVVNSERLNVPGHQGRVRAVTQRIGRTVINHPDEVARLTRQRLPELLAGISNLRIPRIERYRRDLASPEEIAADIETRFDYPIILRLCFAHESASTAKTGGAEVAVLIREPSALMEHLSQSNWPEFYAIEFVNLRRPDGFYRKLRAVAVDQEIFLLQAAMGPRWIVSGGRRSSQGIAFYRANPALHEECCRIVSDAVAELGSGVMQTLEAVRARLPLDMFGVDFDVDQTGRIVLFEASAAMIFLSSAESTPRDVRLPVEPRHRVIDAFRRLIDVRLADATKRIS